MVPANKSNAPPISRKTMMKPLTSITVSRRFWRSSARKSDAAGIESGARRQAEVDLRHRGIFRRGLEILGALESKIARDDVAGEFLDFGVQRQHRIIVSLTREGDLIFGGGEFFLKLHHALIGFQLRIVFHHRQQ